MLALERIVPVVGIGDYLCHGGNHRKSRRQTFHLSQTVDHCHLLVFVEYHVMRILL